MKKIFRISLKFVLFSFLCSTFIFAQEEEEEHSLDIQNLDTFSSTGWVNLLDREQPTLEVHFGFSQPSIDNNYVAAKFSQVNSWEARIGSTKKLFYFDKPSVLKYNHNYLFIGNASTDFVSKSELKADEIQTNTWKFGLAMSDGYGYNLGTNFNITMYNSNAMVWSQVDFKYNDSILKVKPNEADLNYMKYIEGQFRFGNLTEAGLKIQVFSPLSLNVGYERQVVYPRHMFWYWSLSTLIEGLADGAVSAFSEQILKVSPEATPIVHFVLQSALSYGVYELRKNNMNWPTGTEAPVFYDTYKLGLSFSF